VKISLILRALLRCAHAVSHVHSPSLEASFHYMPDSACCVCSCHRACSSFSYARISARSKENTQSGIDSVALAMAPKTLYNAAEVQQKVTETAEKAVKTLEEEGWEFSETTEITCDYLGAATADGYTLDRKPTLRCTVGFKWSYRDESTNESLTKRVRYDYYLSHGITFPEHWKTAFKCDFLSRIAQEAAVRFAQESAFEDVSCYRRPSVAWGTIDLPFRDSGRPERHFLSDVPFGRLCLPGTRVRQ